MGCTDHHVHHADLVFNLADHDAELTRVRGHPHQHAGGRAHRIRRIKLHAGGSPTHSGGLVAGNYAQRFGPSRRFPRKGRKILSRVIVACAGDGQIFGDDCIALLFKLPRNDRLERFRFNPEQFERRAESSGIDCELVALGQFFHRHAAELDTVGRLPGRDLLFVVNGARAALQQMQVPIHRILIERDEDVDLVAHVADRPVTGADCQESVAAADDRLVSVVSVEMQPAPRKDKCENVASGSDPLAVLAANADCEINLVHYAEPFFSVGSANLLRRTLISKRKPERKVDGRERKAPLEPRSFTELSVA